MKLFLKICSVTWVALLWSMMLLGIAGMMFGRGPLASREPMLYMFLFMYVGSQFQIRDLKRQLQKAKELSDYMVRLYK